MSTSNLTESKRRLWVVVTCCVVVPVAMKLGFDFGNRLGGLLLGLAAAANVAILCAFMIDAAVDRLVPAARPQT